jgi:hypothetical protein
MRVVTGLVSAVPWLGWASGPLGFLIGLLVGQLVKYGDLVTYHLGDSWMNNSHGEDYQKAGEALDTLPKTATKEELDAAKKAKSDAFDRLMGAS